MCAKNKEEYCFSQRKNNASTQVPLDVRLSLSILSVDFLLRLSRLWKHLLRESSFVGSGFDWLIEFIRPTVNHARMQQTERRWPDLREVFDPNRSRNDWWQITACVLWRPKNHKRLTFMKFRGKERCVIFPGIVSQFFFFLTAHNAKLWEAVRAAFQMIKKKEHCS